MSKQRVLAAYFGVARLVNTPRLRDVPCASLAAVSRCKFKIPPQLLDSVEWAIRVPEAGRMEIAG